MSLLTPVLAALAALTTSAEPPRPTTPPPIAATAQGRVSGTARDGVSAFLGIPYAAPPVGRNRWRAPQVPARWQGIKPADRFGPSCPQAIVPGGFAPWTQEYVPSGETSEDCLSLNVWKPAGDARKLPVMVWIHGGGFTSGSASVPIYDGAALAREGVVVVSINYRLGFLGSLGSEEFRNSGGGDFGLQDQIAALRWVRRNIAAFGGDPKRMTIAGQSAGAASAHYLILSPQARGLFHQAVPQSGVGLGLGLDLALPTRDKAEKDAAAFLAAAGVGSAEEARALPLERLNAALRKIGGKPGSVDGVKIGPYADGAVLPLDPAAAFRAGRYNDTPIMIGLTADEGSGLNPDYRVSDPTRYEAILHRRFGPLAPELARLYPARAGSVPFPAILRDGSVVSLIDWARERARTSRYPLFGYMWTHVEPGPQSARYGAFHSSELPYVFGTLDTAPDRNFNAEDRRLSAMLSTYWARFVKTGNPNGAGLPEWSAFGAQGTLIELGGVFGPWPAVDPEAAALLRRHVASGGSLRIN